MWQILSFGNYSTWWSLAYVGRLSWSSLSNSKIAKLGPCLFEQSFFYLKVQPANADPYLDNNSDDWSEEREAIIVVSGVLLPSNPTKTGSNEFKPKQTNMNSGRTNPPPPTFRNKFVGGMQTLNTLSSFVNQIKVSFNAGFFSFFLILVKFVAGRLIADETIRSRSISQKVRNKVGAGGGSIVWIIASGARGPRFESHQRHVTVNTFLPILIFKSRKLRVKRRPRRGATWQSESHSWLSPSGLGFKSQRSRLFSNLMFPRFIDRAIFRERTAHGLIVDQTHLGLVSGKLVLQIKEPGNGP